MADFCAQCGMDLYLGLDDLKGLSTAEDTKNKLYVRVLCEGCGPTIVDHLGFCVSTRCTERHALPGHMPPGRAEAYRRARRWVARRAGPLGPLLRPWDRFRGTPWEPGTIHFHPFWRGLRQLWHDLWSGETEAGRILWNVSQGASWERPYEFPVKCAIDDVNPDHMEMLFYGTAPKSSVETPVDGTGVETAGEDHKMPADPRVVRYENERPVQGGEAGPSDS